MMMMMMGDVAAELSKKWFVIGEDIISFMYKYKYHRG